MLSVSTLSSASEATKYYTSYYQGEGHHGRSNWGGEGAKTLQTQGRLTTGTVLKEDLQSILEGKVTNDISIPNRRSAHRPGMDMTFSASKSVSVMALLGNDHRIIDGHQRAIEKTMDYVEKNFAHCRIHNKESGSTEIVGNQKIVYSRFLHDTSRANEPQLHTHVVLANMVHGEDGKWRALSNEAILKNTKFIGQIYRNYLADELVKMGYEIKATKDGMFELAHVDKGLLDLFSTRTKEIEKVIEEGGFDKNSSIHRQYATLYSRQAKEELPIEELRPVWELLAGDKQMNEINQLKQNAIDGKIQQTEIIKNNHAMAQSIKHRSQETTLFTEKEILQKSLVYGLGRIKIEDAELEFGKSSEQGTVLSAKDRKFAGYYTSFENLTIEESIVKRMAIGKGIHRPIATKETRWGKLNPLNERISINDAQRHLDGTILNDGQKNAVLGLLSTQDRYNALQGYAGVGKTTLFKEFTGLAEKNSFKIMGIAPSNSAVETLKNEAGIKDAANLSHFISKNTMVLEGRAGAGKLQQLQKKYEKTVIIMDESTLASNKDINDFMIICDRLKINKVIFSGDVKQLDSVDAGKAFGLLQEHNIKTFKVEQVMRQKDADLMNAVQQAIKGDYNKAFDALSPDYEKNKETHEVNTNEKNIDYANKKAQLEKRAVTYLNVPFADKDIVKNMGAKYDKQLKLWYVNQNKVNEFQRWRNDGVQTNPVYDFVSFARGHGVIIANLEINKRGLRTQVEGDKKGFKSGMYQIFDDGSGIIRGSITNFKTGVSEKWVSKAKARLTEEQYMILKKDSVEKVDSISKEKADLQNAVAGMSQKKYEQATKIGIENEKYLQSKNIKAYDIKRYGTTIYVPIYNINGDLRNIQHIGMDGTKRFKKDGEINGNFNLIDPKNQLKAGQEIIIAEGYATGATIHEATGKPVACAMNASNIVNVAKAFRQEYPNMKIVIAADNDHRNEKNIGIEKGQNAADLVGGKLIIPEFNEQERTAKEKLTDFNDLMKSRGIDIIKSHFDGAFENHIIKANTHSADMNQTGTNNEITNEGRKATIHKLIEVKPLQDRIYLAVPFKERDIAKGLGAKYDGAKKMWYASPEDYNKFPMYHSHDLSPMIAKQAAELYLTDGDSKQQNTLIVSPTNKVRNMINDMVREGLKEKGLIDSQGHNITTLTNITLTDSEKKSITSYSEGQYIMFNTSNLKMGIKKGAEFIIDKKQGKELVIKDSKGNKIVFNPEIHAKQLNPSLYAKREIEIAKNERIKFTRNNTDIGILNNQYAKILDIKGDIITMELDNKSIRTLTRMIIVSRVLIIVIRQQYIRHRVKLLIR